MSTQSDAMRAMRARTRVEIMQARAKLMREHARTSRRFANLSPVGRLFSRLPLLMAAEDEWLADLDEELLLAIREGR